MPYSASGVEAIVSSIDICFHSHSTIMIFIAFLIQYFTVSPKSQFPSISSICWIDMHTNLYVRMASFVEFCVGLMNA